MKPDAGAQAVALAISDATEVHFEPAAVEPVGGGCIHTALRLRGETSAGALSFFVKTNEAERAAMFEAEADGLAALADAGALRVPRVIARGEDGERAWLVLEWLELAPLSTRERRAPRHGAREPARACRSSDSGGRATTTSAPRPR